MLSCTHIACRLHHNSIKQPSRQNELDLVIPAMCQVHSMLNTYACFHALT